MYFHEALRQVVENGAKIRRAGMPKNWYYSLFKTQSDYVLGLFVDGRYDEVMSLRHPLKPLDMVASDWQFIFLRSY